MYPLTISVFLPLAFVLLVVSMPVRYAQRIALTSSLAQLWITLFFLFPAYSAHSNEVFPVYESWSWFQLDLGEWGKLKAEIALGADGLNLLLILLSNLIFIVAISMSHTIQRYERLYYGLLLLLHSAVIGCFMALDFLFFFVCYEFMLLPMFFLIGIWGGDRREYAAIKFFLFTLVGSVFMLLVMVGMAFSVIDPAATAVELKMISHETAFQDSIKDKVQNLLADGVIPSFQQVHSFSLLHMQDMSNLVAGSVFSSYGGLIWGLDGRLLAFWVLLIGFLIKLPSVPFHTWLPDAHVEAPTPVSVILAAVLLKVGGYGLFRISAGLFPDMLKNYSAWIGAFGGVSIVYGALAAIAQTDLKRMVAYSSVSHMGFVLLGLASLEGTGWNGAIFQLFSHGIISAALFLIVGVLYERVHSRDITHFQGLWHKMPFFTGVVIICFFAGLGLPTMSSFVAELLVLMGSIGSWYHVQYSLPTWVAVAGVIGIFLSAVYFIRAFRMMFMGNWHVLRPEWETELYDLTTKEKIIFGILILSIIIPGLMPSVLLSWIDDSLVHFLRFVMM